MPEPTPLDELMTAWRKLGEEGLTAVRRAFEAGRAEPFATASPEEPAAEAGPPPPANVPAPPPPPPPPPHDVARDLREIRDLVAALDGRLGRIEDSLAAIAGDAPWLDDDYDDAEGEVIPVRAMELRVKGMKRNRKGRKKK